MQKRFLFIPLMMSVAFLPLYASAHILQDFQKKIKEYEHQLMPDDQQRKKKSSNSTKFHMDEKKIYEKVNIEKTLEKDIEKILENVKSSFIPLSIELKHKVKKGYEKILRLWHFREDNILEKEGTKKD